ncbi:phosphotransferase family protein [Sphingobium sp. CFD-2]|uniref:phosphotransferase family protein n=1 Tax=Sphingobium sp. CFD-2 TaxID=2878542 RepID=UPI00214B2689|nr:phosphotransferase family protein [Sphingobium sp. CFD-2]
MKPTPNFSGIGAVREAHRFDEVALARWMDANVAGYTGPLSVEQFQGGQSNPTYRLVTPTRSYVMRRKPPGKLLKGAHAIEREAQVLIALAKADFPVAEVYGLCTDEDVIGTCFYVMELVVGRTFWTASCEELQPADRTAAFDAMNATIARLHSVDHEAIGLSDYGRPGSYFERQISRWSRQYLEDPLAGRDPAMDRLIDWLPSHIPDVPERTSIIHGDFRVDNMIYHSTSPRILAVLDWELSTVGDPLADFAYHLMMYRMPQLTIPGLAGLDLAALGIPSEADYVASYCSRTGRSGIPNLEFYLAFNFFRFAAIIHGIKGRLARGTATSPHARSLVDDLTTISALGWDIAQAN